MHEKSTFGYLEWIHHGIQGNIFGEEKEQEELYRSERNVKSDIVLEENRNAPFLLVT